MKNEFDNDLTDKGWQSMRRLLDREMPEQRRRRRFAWWLFALLLLPLAGAGGWWLLGESKLEKAKPPMEAPKVSEPVAKAENVSGNNEATPPRLVFSPSDDNANGCNLTSHEVPLGENTKHGEKNLSKVEAHSSGDSKSSDELKTGTYSSDDFKSSDELTYRETFRKFQTFGKLEPLPVSLQFVENEIKNTPRPSNVTPFATATTKKHSEPNHWHFGLAAGLASENFSAFNGFSAGGAVDWQFARKWGLRSGLQFAQYNLSAEERPVVSLTASDYKEATGNSVTLGTGSNPSTDPLASTVLVPIERLQQLEMPLLAYWQPMRPLRIFGGISTAYTLSAQASSQSYANNQFFIAADQTAQENLNDLTSKTLSRWQMSWQAGAGVRLGRHFELGAFYKQGMNSNGNSADNAQDNFNPNVPADLSGQPSGDFKSHYFLLNGIWFF